MFPTSSFNQIGSSGGNGQGLMEDVSTRVLKTTAVGQNAGKISTGSGNAFVGYESGRANKSGSFDTFIGYQSGAENTQASYCTFVGALAGRKNQRGSGSVFVGYSAGELNADGVECVGIGAYAMRENVSGNRCVAIGYRAAERMLNGDFNTMVGAESGQDNRSGNYNTTIGYRSGRALFNGDKNTFSGAFAGYSNQQGSGNAFIGYSAGFANQGNRNTVVGANAGTFLEGDTNVIVGSESALYLQGDASVVIGTKTALNLLYGSSNIFLGSGANSFFTSNTHSICIGTKNAKAMSYGIVLGEDIETRRQGTISLGFNIQSDADNSILMGNDLNINSVINFNNTLQFNLRNIALEDGFLKFGICNIQYTNFLQLSSNVVPFTVAQSGAITSNLLSSTNNRLHGTLSPASYDLRSVMPNYALFNGKSVVLSSNLSIGTVLFATTDVLKLVSSNVGLNVSSVLSGGSITYTSALQYHDYNSTLSYSSSAIMNILKYAQQNGTFPIHILKNVAAPFWSSLSVSGGNSNLLLDAGNVIQNRNIGSSLHYSNVHVTFANAGLSSNNTHLVANVTSPPRYGVIEPVFFHPSNVQSLTYTPYIQQAFQKADSFVIKPSLNIVDGNNKAHSCSSTCNIEIHILLSSNQQLQTALYAFSNMESVLSIQNFFQIPNSIDSNAQIQITSLPSNTFIEYNNIVYSSNDVITMVNERIIDYPDGIKGSLLQTIQNDFNQQISILDTDRRNLLRPTAISVSSNVYDLSNVIVAPALSLSHYSRVLNDFKQVERASIDQNAAQVITSGFSNQWYNFSSNLNTWMAAYDPLRLTYQPFSSNLVNNVFSFTSNLFDKKRFAVEESFAAYKNISGNLSLRSSSNEIANNVKLSPIVFFAYDIPQTLNSYDTWFRKYNEIPRLFTSYNDILQESLKVRTYVSNIMKGSHIQLVYNSNNFHIPYAHYPATSQWSSPFSSNVSLNIPMSLNADKKGVSIPKIALPSIYTSNIFVKTRPSICSIIDGSQSNLESWKVRWLHPRKSQDEFALILQNASNQSKPTRFTMTASTVSYLMPLHTPYYTPLSSVRVSCNIDTSYTNISLSNVINVQSNITQINNMQSTSGFTQFLPLASYNHLIGTSTTYSNISIAYDLLSVSNNTTNYQVFDTVHCNVFQYFTSNVLTDKIVQQYTSLSSNVSLSLSSNIRKTEIALIDTYFDFVRTSNTFFHSNTTYFSRYYNLPDTSSASPLYELSNVTIESKSNLVIQKYLGVSPTLTMSAFSNLMVSSNIDYKNSYYNLLPSSYYDRDSATNTWQANNQTPIIKSGIGIVSTFSYADVESAAMFIKVPSSTTAIYINNLVQDILVYPQVSPIKPTVQLSKRLQLSHSNFVTLNDVMPLSELGILPTTLNSVHIVSSSNGVFLENDQMKNSFALANRSAIEYHTIDSSTLTDVITYNYIGPNLITSNVTCHIGYDRTPALGGKVINTGIDINGTATLEPSEFRLSLSNIAPTQTLIEIWESTGLDIFTINPYTTLGNGSRFPLSEINERNVGIKATTTVPANTYIRYKVYDGSIPAAPTLVINDAIFPVRCIKYSEYPALSESEISDISIEQWLDPGATSNVLSGLLWNRISTFRRQGSVLDPGEVECVLNKQPMYGVLMLKQPSLMSASSFTMSNVLRNEVVYVPFNPAALRNDTCTIRLLIDNDWSSKYTIRFKNYAAYYSPRVWDPTYILPKQRQWRSIENIQISDGLIDDGYAIVDQLYEIPLQTTYPFALTKVPFALSNSLTASPRSFDISLKTNVISLTPKILANEVTVVIDQADRFSLSNIVMNATNISYDSKVSKTLVAVIGKAPQHGIILNTTSRNAVVKFTEAELLADEISYLHVGSNVTYDDFTIHIGSHEYNMSSNALKINVNIQPLPRVIKNVQGYTYEFTSNNALSNIHELHSTFESDYGFLQVLSNANVIVRDRESSNLLRTIAMSDITTNDVGYNVVDSLFTSGTMSPFPALNIDFVPNNKSSYHVNPIINESLYRGLFVQRWTNYFNKYENSNIDLSQHSSNQFIVYDFNQKNTNFLKNITDKSITLSLQIKPIQNFNFTSDTVEFVQAEFLRDYRFEMQFFADGTDSLLRIVFFQKFIKVISKEIEQDIEIPTELLFKYHAWNNVQVINFDVNNNNNLSIYYQFNSSDFQSINNTRNVLFGKGIPSIDFNHLSRLHIYTNIYDPNNFIGTMLSNASYGSNLLPAFFNLRNYSQTLQVQNFILAASTYSRVFDAFEDYDPSTHNIAIGKQIQVKGNNNICLGNQFSTSGTNSIIIGNNIGTVLDGTNDNNVSDIYESIIIGNDSFKNAFIRDMISIGTDQFNDLFDDALDDTIADKLNKFLSKRPIIIGNDINKSKLDYEVNLANVFLKTTEGGNKVFLGNNNEQVAIGFSSNESLDPNYLVHVNGSIEVSGPLKFTSRNMETINQQMSSATSFYDVSGAANLGANIYWDTTVIGVSIKTMRVIATCHLIKDDSNFAYRRFEGLINCISGTTTPRLTVTFDTKSYASSLFSNLSHSVTRNGPNSVQLLFQWTAEALMTDYEGTLHVEVYAPLDMGMFRFNSFRL